ncbi:MAG: hypothetical protein HPY74_06085 [Firmicutes bacterium]|nr:hypothetical protein [Bacillota bacterium]
MNLWILLPTAVGIITGIIGYLTKRSIDAIDQKIVTANKRIDDLNEKLDSSNKMFNKAIDSLKSEFYEFKEKVGDEFVRKSDFVMTTSEISKKLDKVYDILLDFKGRLRA